MQLAQKPHADRARRVPLRARAAVLVNVGAAEEGDGDECLPEIKREVVADDEVLLLFSASCCVFCSSKASMSEENVTFLFD